MSNGTRYSSGGYRLSKGTPDIGLFNDSLWERAINGALEKLKNQSVDLSVAFAERKRTSDLLLQTAKTVAKSIDRIRSAKKGRIWDAVKRTIPGKQEYPNEWLKAVYGWQPLISDMEGSCEAIAKMELGELNPYFIRIHKREFEGANESLYRPEFMAVAGHSDKGLWVDESSREDAVATFYYELDKPLLIPFTSLGLTNPSSTAYELLPFSFVLDWALPVGNWLNLLDADFGWRYLDGCVTRVKKRVARGQFFQLPANFSVYEGSAESCGYSLFSMNRTVFLSAPWPVFPSFKNPLTGTKRNVTAASLLLQKAYR